MIRNMDEQQKTTEFLLAQCAAYPALRPQDLLKGLHQSVFGCGHFVTDDAKVLLLAELAELRDSNGADMEPLDGSFYRVHLRILRHTSLSSETLFRLFALSAKEPCGDLKQLERRLSCLLALAGENRLPFSAAQLLEDTAAWGKAGYPACHHSAAFRAAYHPAYRVIHSKFIPWLPLLARIDGLLAQKSRVLLALEGGSASGKTTLAAMLADIYGCTVFHMDDFFLQPHQRTPMRLAEAGGNVDRERFLTEVLLPARHGKAVRYQRYDCHTQALLPAVAVSPAALTVVEGAYSMHPELAACYDLSVFLQITPELQRLRLLKRNGSIQAEPFFSTWLPMERTYFEATGAAARCDLRLEVDTCEWL